MSTVLFDVSGLDPDATEPPKELIHYPDGHIGVDLCRRGSGRWEVTVVDSSRDSILSQSFTSFEEGFAVFVQRVLKHNGRLPA